VYPFVPGVDGVGITADGSRVYFVMPEAPFGAMAERTLVDPRRTVPVPVTVDDVTAAALANPGMSCWAALVERARFQPGETVLINGATGSAGSVAVQVAKHLGAKKIIVTGRNAGELSALRTLGADVVIPFDLRPDNSQGAEDFERALTDEFAHGITSGELAHGPSLWLLPRQSKRRILFASFRSVRPAANSSNCPVLRYAHRPSRSWAAASSPFHSPGFSTLSATPSNLQLMETSISLPKLSRSPLSLPTGLLLESHGWFTHSRDPSLEALVLISRVVVTNPVLAWRLQAKSLIELVIAPFCAY
jgi:hypothetical protein